ncbi:MAG: SIMPL domain-containing protein [Defluviitaleaceae bacterium]|nr:SIMPL domain-containing protein [Defluviitaleaceae bacterium]MCL2262620.1 SIMPL domain-containing protein [Defluviitaleaceae bacterium]
MNSVRRTGVAVILAVIFSAMMATVAFGQTERPNISVSGAGAVTATPDIATIVFGVNTENRDARTAITTNNRDIANVLAAVKAQGISEDDIVTHQFTLSPRMDWQRGTADGYTVSNTITVTLRDMDIIGEIMGAAIEAGANVTGNVRFSVYDSVALYQEALAIAAQDARDKANALALAMNVNISTILSVTEQSTWASPVARAGSWAMMEDAEMAMPMSAGGWGVPIQTGEITITARINVVFAIN